jgi:hypothetical protein
LTQALSRCAVPVHIPLDFADSLVILLARETPPPSTRYVRKLFGGRTKHVRIRILVYNTCAAGEGRYHDFVPFLSLLEFSWPRDT